MGNKQGHLSQSDANALAAKTHCTATVEERKGPFYLSGLVFSFYSLLRHCSNSNMVGLYGEHFCAVDISELQSLQKGFKEVDKDKSGDLDIKEFKALMKKELKSEMTDETLQVRSMIS